MAVIRVNHTTDFTVMSNYHLRDKDLSLKAKGLLSQMLSLPPEWDYSLEGLAAINREQATAISTAIKELKKRGYLVVTKLTPDKTETGRFEYIYDVYERPQGKQGVEKQGIDFLPIEFQGIENQGQYNKEESNKDKSNKDDKRECAHFVPPTVEQAKAYIVEQGLNVDAERFCDYYQSNGWKVGRSAMKDWKAAVRNWARRDRQPGAGANGVKLADERQTDLDGIL